MTSKDLEYKGKQILLFTVVLLLLFVLGCSLTKHSPTKLRIWILADTHIGYAGGDGIASLERAVADVNLIGVDWAITLGDVVDERAVNSELGSVSAAVQEYYRVMSDLQASGHHLLRDNHDYDTTYSPPRDAFAGIALCKSFSVGNIHFILLSDITFGMPCRLGSAQISWLESELRNNQDKNVIVCSHFPLPSTVRAPAGEITESEAT